MHLPPPLLSRCINRNKTVMSVSIMWITLKMLLLTAVLLQATVVGM